MPPIPDNITLADVQQLIEKREATQQQQLLLLDSIWQNRQARQMSVMQVKLNQQLVAYQTQQQREITRFCHQFSPRRNT